MDRKKRGPIHAALEGDWLGRWILRLPAVERPILFLRWFSLVLVLSLHVFDRSTAGVLLPTPYMAVVVAVYNGLLLLLMRYLGWLRGPLNTLAVDTVIATLAVYLTGGYHSSFYILYVFIVIGAAFHLDLTRTVIVSLAIGLIYVGACYVNPAGLRPPEAVIFLSAKLMGLLIVAVLCGLLLEQLRREHQETERERTLAERLAALNDLLRDLGTTLNLDDTLRTVAEAPRLLLHADIAAIALLDERGEVLTVAASAGVDESALSGQRWALSEGGVPGVLFRGEPYVVDRPRQLLAALPEAVAKQPVVRSVEAMVFAPLTLDERPLGLLIAAYHRPRSFSGEDLSFLQALGQEAALAIRNARLYERERQQVARLQELDELQHAFVSAVSHELRTPLTCIKTSVDLLHATRDSLSEEQRELTRTIGHHVGRLEGLVNDLLDLTRLEAGQVTLSPQVTDLREMVRRAVETLRPLTVRKGQVVVVELPESASPVEVDRRRIDQALTNILSNAIKFTPKRGRLDVRLVEASDELRVCVADSGPGISPADQAHLFERFSVVSDGRGLSGVGLGLYIARQMIELHGGRIWVESDVGRGSTFCFTVPKGVRRGDG